MAEEWIYVSNNSNEKVKSFRCDDCNWIIQKNEVIELGEDKHRCFACECYSIWRVDCEHRYFYELEIDDFVCKSCGLLQGEFDNSQVI
jgi:hypothetical protein